MPTTLSSYVSQNQHSCILMKLPETWLHTSESVNRVMKWMGSSRRIRPVPPFDSLESRLHT